MKPLWKDVLISLFMGLVLPGILLNGMSLMVPREPSWEPAVTQPETIPVPKTSIPVSVTEKDGSIRQMDLEEYLVGVVLGEMPAYFETEALKAQSVVARTYTLKTITTGGKHGGGICTDPGCCQAYTSEETFLQQGGTAQQMEKVRSAVHSTSGEILTYDGGLIEATYFSCSGGSTEDAAAVWGTDYPYLRAVSSPGEEHAAYFTDTKTFDREVFCAVLDIAPSGNPESWLGRPTYTPGGGVASVRIGGKDFTGIQLRSLLGLRSTAITFSVDGDRIVASTKGFGHRVGMSQYGADAMAVAGNSYREILEHYYPGTCLEFREGSIAGEYLQK